MANIRPYRETSLANVENDVVVSHLTEDELQRLTEAFRKYYDEVENIPKYARRAAKRGRYWIIFLFLRYTGARLSEVLNIDEGRDIDIRNSEVRLITLKRQGKRKKGKVFRIIPISPYVINEYLRFISLHPELKGKIFKLNRSNFYKVFYKLARDAGIPDHLAHPHILRHTRAVELVRAGIPITVVQQLLGHATLNTTAIYLRYSSMEVKAIMKDRGLI